MMWGYGSNWLGITLMIFVPLLVLAVLVWAVTRRLNQRTISPGQLTQTPPVNAPTALEILSQRYARGDIDTVTYEQMRERLEASDNAQQRSWEEPLRPAGESLFDGVPGGPKSF